MRENKVLEYCTKTRVQDGIFWIFIAIERSALNNIKIDDTMSKLTLLRYYVWLITALLLKEVSMIKFRVIILFILSYTMTH